MNMILYLMLAIPITILIVGLVVIVGPIISQILSDYFRKPLVWKQNQSQAEQVYRNAAALPYQWKPHPTEIKLAEMVRKNLHYNPIEDSDG